MQKTNCGTALLRAPPPLFPQLCEHMCSVGLCRPWCSSSQSCGKVERFVDKKWNNPFKLCYENWRKKYAYPDIGQYVKSLPVRCLVFLSKWKYLNRVNIFRLVQTKNLAYHNHIKKLYISRNNFNRALVYIV